MKNLTSEISVEFAWDHNFTHVGIVYDSEDPVLSINKDKNKNLREDSFSFDDFFEWWKRPNYVSRYILNVNMFEFIYLQAREDRLKAKVSDYDTSAMYSRLYFRQ